MNKYQEALDEIKSKKLKQGTRTILDFGYVLEKEINTLQELLDNVPYYKELERRATPKKPQLNHYIDGTTKTTCPNRCGIQLHGLSKNGEIMSFTHEYCPKCGQALDWSDE